MFIAVVYTATGLSGRHEGDFASFVATTKEEAIQDAIDARSKWETKGYGPYRLLVGKLSEEVAIPTRYEIVKLGSSRRPQRVR